MVYQGFASPALPIRFIGLLEFFAVARAPSPVFPAFLFRDQLIVRAINRQGLANWQNFYHRTHSLSGVSCWVRPARWAAVAKSRGKFSAGSILLGKSRRCVPQVGAAMALFVSECTVRDESARHCFLRWRCSSGIAAGVMFCPGRPCVIGCDIGGVEKPRMPKVRRIFWYFRRRN
jgi:hypothetical protein